MGTISSSVGLATGMDIAGTVEALMSIEGRRRDNLATQNETLQTEQYALTELAALLISTQYVGENFGKEKLFEERSVTSSNDAVLAATKTGEPLDGTYSFTPIQTAQNQQLLSQGFKSDTDALGGGEVRLRFGNHVARGMSLDELNGGQGVQRGYIRITDRSGATAIVDLSSATSIDDVLETINKTGSINVTAKAAGDHIELTDNTGQSGTLSVQDVNGGSTAAWLGLDGVSTTDATGVGRDIVYLSDDTPLSILNDLNGLEHNTVLSDIDFVLHNGTVGKIDFSSLKEGATKEVTLGDILDTINAAAPGKLVASISDDGDRIKVIDTTSGAASFVMGAMNKSPALRALGLDVEKDPTSHTMEGRRIQGGLKTVLLSSLNGGNGYDQALADLPDDAAMKLTTSAGNVTFDLTPEVVAGVETLEDLMNVFNTAGESIGLKAELNSAKTGIVLRDANMGSSSYLKVADTKGDFAAIFGLAGESDDGSIATGDMKLKTVSLQTKLEDFNGGAGVRQGKIRITDTSGKTSELVIDSDFETIGDVIVEINRLDVDVLAELNDAGDGIRLVDTADGEGELSVRGDGYTHAAADLHLVGKGKKVEIDGVEETVVDGSTTYVISLDEEDTLDDLRVKINELEADVYASTFVDGSSNPYRLSLLSQRSGKNGQMVVDMTDVGLKMTETVEAQDAVMIYGNPSSTGANVLVSSSTNTFSSVVGGISLEVKQASTTPIVVSVKQTHTDLVATAQTFVTNYNNFRAALDEYTYYDETTGKGSVLSGDATARRLDEDMSFFFTEQFQGTGSITMLAELGIRITDTGKLTFDQEEMKKKIAEDPAAVRDFFLGQKVDDGGDAAEKAAAASTRGFYAAFKRVTESLIGRDTSATATRFTTLQDIIERNEQKIEWWDEKLELETERLFMQFYNMEIAVSRMQTNMTYISAIQDLAATSMGGSDDG